MSECYTRHRGQRVALVVLRVGHTEVGYLWWKGSYCTGSGL